jgi:hypothetical protein
VDGNSCRDVSGYGSEAAVAPGRRAAREIKLCLTLCAIKLLPDQYPFLTSHYCFNKIGESGPILVQCTPLTSAKGAKLPLFAIITEKNN